MLVFPAGTTKARDGRGPFHLKDRAAMQAVIDRTLQYMGGIEAMVDYDHALNKVDKPGATAKAAGWIKQWEAREDGIWALVAWTEPARAAIRSSEYRYLSPLFYSDTAGNLLQFLNVSLVNHPGFDLEAIAARAETAINPKDTSMDFMKKLAKKLGLDESASEEALLAAVGKLQSADKDTVAAAVETGISEALKPVALAAGFKDSDKVDAKALAEKVTAIAATGAAAGTGDQDKTITALQAELKDTATQLNALKSQIATSDAETFIDQAITEGRVGVKPLRDHYIKRYAASAEGAAAVKTEIVALPTVSGTVITTPSPSGDGVTALSASQKETARVLGMSEDEYLEAVKLDQGA